LEYRFIINEIEPAENLLEINNFSETEIANARGLIEKLSTKKNDIMKYIFSKASKGLGIKGLDHSPLLKVSLEFLVLQSLSDYTAGNRSAKLHSMIVGPPAVGKGKLSEAVRVLNPLFREASIAKPTPAGFIGTSKSEGGKWKSEPGLFPLAHRGVLIIQDFHELKSKHETFNIFSKVMEDGVVIDSSSSRATHLALTALHLDTNKLADVYFDDSDRIQKSRYKKLKKIGIPLQILSRFDFIADFARDTAIQNMIARKMLNSDGSSKSLIGDLVFEPWVRELQAIVAILRTDFIDIIFTPVIKKYMQEKYDELTKEIGPGDDYISDFLPRMSQSFIKIVTATCRGNARKEASKEDVDYAYRFVKLKLDFLMAVKPERVGNDGKSSTTISPALLINIKYEGETITLPMAREYVNSHIDNPVSERQIRRYLEGISEKAGRGKWKINKLTF
ncbi:MAG: minichromosome maintenance protein MCM, partial [candidate division Zixibacteria bacterium]|nr:minichromosome maintenance protein MCM [candidate division Zixibacteria bacterium]